MDMKKLAPWNWFSEEEARENAHLAQGWRSSLEFPSMARMQHRLDRLFDDMFHRSAEREPAVTGPAESLLLKPSVDIAATDDRYHISVEVPGIDEKDLELRLVGNTLVIRGEKKREQQQTDKASFYRLERSFGAFRRVLSLPEDAEAGDVEAAFSNGVLSITFPRKAEPEEQGKVIDIRSAA